MKLMEEVAKWRAQESVLKQRVEQKQVTNYKIFAHTVHDTRNFTKFDEFHGKFDVHKMSTASIYIYTCRTN